MEPLSWWMRSPSPVTVCMYALFALWGAQRLLKRAPYKHLRYVMAFIDALMVLGVIVLIGDLIWVVGILLRFGSQYPGSVRQLLFCGARDIAGLAFCLLLTEKLWKNHAVIWTRNTTYGILFNMIFMGVWFTLAPSPVYTDWTYAIIHGQPTHVIAFSFFISHVLGRIITAEIYGTLYK